MAPTLLEHAMHYASLGASVIPVVGKEVEFKYSVTSREWRFPAHQTFDALPKLPWETATGVAVFQGENEWRCLDFDNCPDIAPITAMLVAMDLPNDYPWVVRSGTGYHLWVRASAIRTFWISEHEHQAANPQMVTTFAPVDPFNFQVLELRWSGANGGGYVLLPPSAHPIGTTYQFVNTPPITAPAIVTPEQLATAIAAVGVYSEPLRPSDFWDYSDYGEGYDEHEYGYE